MAVHKLSKQEAKDIPVVPYGKKHVVRAMLETLEPGEKLHIGKQDFKWKKRTPAVIINQMHRSGKARFKIFNKVGRTGWVVERVE